MKSSIPRKIIAVCLTAAMAGLVLGIDIGVIAQAKDFIQSDLHVSDTVLSVIAGAMMGGATIGALCGGVLTRKLGRKYSLIISAVCFVISAACGALAWNGTILVTARILVGISLGVASFTAPLYLSEVAPKSIRGTMITLYQLMITVGILISFIVNTMIRYGTFTGAEGQIASEMMFGSVSYGWRTMLGVTLIPATAFLIGLMFLPKSPRWLISAGRRDEALAVLEKIRGSGEEAREEAEEIISTVAAQTGGIRGFGLFRGSVFFRKAVYLGIALQLMQQLCGINVIMYFGPELIKNAGFSSEFATNLGTIIIGLTNVLATFIAVAFIEKWGRRIILLAGYSIMSLSMICVALFMHLNMSMAAIASVLVFIIAFAFSAGPVAWVLCSEIQPIAGRDFGITCSTVANWLSNMTVVATFLPLIKALGSAETMIIYAAVSVVSVILILLYVPETRGVSLERIEDNLMKGRKLRDLGQTGE